MDDEQFDALMGSLKKMGDLQIRTLTKVTRLQAQVLVQQALICGLQANAGGDPEEIKAKSHELFVEFDNMLLSGLKDWLAKNEMAFPPGDDSWWDRPSS